MAASNSVPVVTIALPVFNAERFLDDAVTSVLGQSFSDLELVISDNASTDGTEDACRRFAEEDSRVRYVRGPFDVGAAKNFNRTVALARGRYFKWICHDDYIAESFLERCVTELEADRTASSVTPITTVVGLDNRILYTLGGPEPELCAADPVLRHRRMIRLLDYDQTGLLMGHYMYGLHRLSSLKRTRLVGNYITSDAVLATELALSGRISSISEPLSFLRKPGRTAICLEVSNYRGVQEVLDPSVKRRLAIEVSKRRRYLEYFAAVAASELTLGAKLRGAQSCCFPSLRRARQILDNKRVAF